VPGHRPPVPDPEDPGSGLGLSPSGQPVISSPGEDPAVTDELIRRPPARAEQGQLSKGVKAGDPDLVDKVGWGLALGWRWAGAGLGRAGLGVGVGWAGPRWAARGGETAGLAGSAIGTVGLLLPSEHAHHRLPPPPPARR
jgi:hypothetical protein